MHSQIIWAKLCKQKFSSQVWPVTISYAVPVSETMCDINYNSKDNNFASIAMNLNDPYYSEKKRNRFYDSFYHKVISS